MEPHRVSVNQRMGKNLHLCAPPTTHIFNTLFRARSPAEGATKYLTGYSVGKNYLSPIPRVIQLALKLRFSLKEKIDLPTLAFVRVHSCVRVCVCVAAMNTPTVHLGNSKSIPQMS